jgi:hypothetical protein
MAKLNGNRSGEGALQGLRHVRDEVATPGIRHMTSMALVGRLKVQYTTYQYGYNGYMLMVTSRRSWSYSFMSGKKRMAVRHE